MSVNGLPQVVLLALVLLLVGAGFVVMVRAVCSLLGPAKAMDNGPSLARPDQTILPSGGGHPLAALGFAEQLSAAFEHFEQWLAQWDQDSDPWTSFAEWVRATLGNSCGASHVRLYRFDSSGKELVPLREDNPLVQVGRLSARRGIVGHVVTTGRRYVAGQSMGSGNEKVEALAAETEGNARIAWCFLAQQGGQRLGVVTAGSVGVAPECLRLAEAVVGRVWADVAMIRRVATLERFDPVCGVPARPAFLECAQQVLDESYSQRVPVAIAVLAIEGLRGLNDNGRWEVADELLAEVGRMLQSKVRSDDRLGRFDGSRFVILLRGVDSELATLIMRQLLAQLTMLCDDTPRWRSPISIRCGLAGSGTKPVSLRTLLAQALGLATAARVQGRIIASDLVEQQPMEAGSR